MDKTESTINQQVALAAKAFQLQQTGRSPSKVSVVIDENTLVVTLHEALSPAEQALATSPEGAANLRELHQQLFQNSVSSLRKEIERITGRQVREAVAEIDPGTGSVVHAFTTGTCPIVQQEYLHRRLESLFLVLTTGLKCYWTPPCVASRSALRRMTRGPTNYSAC